MSVSKWLMGCVVAVAVCVGLSGCGDGDGVDNGNGNTGGSGAGDVYLTCKVNGKSVRIDGLGCVVANYQTKEMETVVQTGGPQQYRFVIAIPGKTTGSWSLGDGYLSLSVTEMDAMSVYMSSRDYEDQGASLRVSVSSFGSVGGYVHGTFSGTVVNQMGSTTLVVTDGVFHASRIADI